MSNLRSDLTYEELKLNSYARSTTFRCGSDLTYEELKLESVGIDLKVFFSVQILPMRN